MSTQTRSPNSDYDIPAGARTTEDDCSLSGGKDPQCVCTYNTVNFYPKLSGAGTIGRTSGDCAQPGTNGIFWFGFQAFSVPSGAQISSVSLTRSGGTAGYIRVNGVSYSGSSWATNPNTGAAWTVADVNGSGSHPLQLIGAEFAGYSTIDTLSVTVTYTETQTYELSGSFAANLACSGSESIAVGEAGSIAFNLGFDGAIEVLPVYEKDGSFQFSPDVTGEIEGSVPVLGTGSIDFALGFDAAMEVVMETGGPWAVVGAGPAWIKNKKMAWVN